MRSQCVCVFSASPCLTRVLIGCQAMLLALSVVPAASPQDTARTAIQTAATTPSNAPASTANAANDRISQMALVQAAKKVDYVVDSGDLLGIEVFDVPELTRDARVSESGLISIPLLPVKVRATGLTAFQLQDKLAELLLVNGLVSNPQVTVTVKEQHGQPITVMGAVRTPQVIQATRPMSLLEALSRAGGIAEDAAGQILVTHAPVVPAISENTETADADAPQLSADASDPAPTDTAATTAAVDSSASPDPLTVRVSLSDLLDSGDSKFNLALRGGDVVSVPRAGVVYAVGAVQHAGGFVMANDRQQLTVLKVLALSGGLAPNAKKKNAVIIRQSAESDKRQVPVDLERILAFKEEDPLLLQSDILFVPTSGGKQAVGKMMQMGLGLASGVALVRLGSF
jgi:polysaccharide biosynthesis/export protein